MLEYRISNIEYRIGAGVSSPILLSAFYLLSSSEDGAYHE